MPKNMIPVYRPMLTGNEKRYVDDCIDTTWISSKGKYVSLFETQFAKYIGCQYGVSVSNGTVALHLAMLALGIGAGDEVIVPTFTYIASANAVTYVGAKLIFADSDSTSWQIDPNDVVAKITPNTRAIMAVHLYGQPCEMDRLAEIAREHKLFLIEDCAEAIGSEYNRKKVGVFGDVACFSFFGNKTITTGEGGMLLTNDKTLYERARHIKDQGNSDYREYWCDIVGYNFRMTNIEAAIGCAQLEKIEEHIKMKEEIFARYKERLAGLPVTLNTPVGDVRHTYWMVTILVDDDRDRDDLRTYLKENEVETRPTFYPVHLMPMYAGHYRKLPVAENLSYRGINLPSWPGLSNEDIVYICDCIRNYYSEKQER